MTVDVRPQLVHTGPTWCEWTAALAHECWVPLCSELDGTKVLVRPVTLTDKRSGTVRDVAGTCYRLDVTQAATGTKALLTIPHCHDDRALPARPHQGPFSGYYSATVQQCTEEPAGMFTRLLPAGEPAGRPAVYLQLRGFMWWAITRQSLPDVYGVWHNVISAVDNHNGIALRFGSAAE